MKKMVLLAVAALIAATSLGQNNKIRRIPEVKRPVQPSSVYNLDKGFWFAAEASAGMSLQSHDNAGFGEVDFTLGYRFNEYFRIGPGAGVRYYFPAESLREKNFRWSFPLYANVRGNFLSMQYRNVVPYYSVDFGGAIQDGFMWRPSVGVRIGQPRGAFIASIAYMGQNVREYNDNRAYPGYDSKGTRYVSFISLRLGYEF